jgi:hypothetical protein
MPPTRLTRRGEYAVAALAVIMFFAAPVLAGAMFRWWML